MAVTTAKVRRKRNKTAYSSPPLLVAAAVALSVPASARAGEWKFTPGLDVVETYTDNFRMAAAGAEQSQLITQVTPKLLIKGTGRNVNVKLDYAMRNSYYSNASTSHTTSHLLNALATAEVARSLLYFDAKSTISQQDISPFAAAALNDSDLTNNRAELRTYSLSPYLKHQFGKSVNAELRYTHDSVTSSAAGFLNSASDGVSLSIKSGEAFRSLPWGLNYRRQKTDYKNSSSYENESGQIEVRYPLTPRFSVSATAGEEKNSFLATAQNASGPFWSSGFTWAPSSRTSLAATVGHRFYGTSYSLTANHRTRHTVWNIAYNEDITTARAQFLVPATIDTSAFLNELWKASVPDPVARQNLVDSFIQDSGLPSSLATMVNLATNRVFILKNWQASVAFNGAKSTLVLTALDNHRDALSPAGVDSTLLGASATAQNSVHQSAINALWNWRLSSRSFVNLASSYSRNYSPATGLKSTVRTDRITFTRQLQPKLKGKLEWQRLHQISGQLAGAVDANTVTLSINMGF